MPIAQDFVRPWFLADYRVHVFQAADRRLPADLAGPIGIAVEPGNAFQAGNRLFCAPGFNLGGDVGSRGAVEIANPKMDDTGMLWAGRGLIVDRRKLGQQVLDELIPPIGQ